MIIEILPLLIAFAATIVGIAGDTWDEGKKGLRKLTTSGRVVVFLALASFGAAVYQARAAVVARKEQERKELLLRDLAREDVMSGIDELLDPLKRLIDTGADLWATDSTRSGAVINKRLYKASDYLDRIGSGEFLDAPDNVRAITCPKELIADPEMNWARMIGIAASRGDERFKEVVVMYSAVLPPAAIELIEQCRKDTMLNILKSASGNLEINQDIGSKDVEKISIGFLLRGPHKPEKFYLPFFALLKQIRDEVGSKRPEPDRWWLPGFGK